MPSVARVIPPRVAVLASGYGTNLQALLDDPVTRPWIALVVSDRDSAVALARAEAHGVATAIVDPARSADRPSFDAELLRVLRDADVGFVVLAGYLRLLGPEVVRAYEGRILNVHPSLLPAFPGARAIDEALQAGVETTGVTVHLVDEGLDSGPVVRQEPVPVEPRETLVERIHAVEHRLLPEVVRDLCAR